MNVIFGKTANAADQDVLAASGAADASAISRKSPTRTPLAIALSLVIGWSGLAQAGGNTGACKRMPAEATSNGPQLPCAPVNESAKRLRGALDKKQAPFEGSQTSTAIATEAKSKFLGSRVDDGALAAAEGTRYFQANGVGDGSDDAQAVGQYAIASGASSYAEGMGATAYGTGAMAVGEYSTANGFNAAASGLHSVASGYAAQASGQHAIAVGYNSVASEEYASAYGAGVEATGRSSLAIGGVYESSSGMPYGRYTRATGQGSTAVGAGAEATGLASMAIGGAYERPIGGGTIPIFTRAQGEFSTAVGTAAFARASGSTALGMGSLVEGRNSVAIGKESLAERDNTVSFGVEGGERQLTRVAAGVQATDAVNVSQLSQLGAVLGGGAGFSSGVWIAPTYRIQGGVYRSVGDAFAAVDSKLTALFGDRVGADPAASPQTVPAQDGSTVTSLGEGGAISHAPAPVTQASVRAAAADTPAAAYVDASAARTLSSANAYTDARFTTLNDSFVNLRGDVERRFAQQDRRFDRMGAMSAAMLNMATNAAGSRSPRGRMAVGAGWQNGESAMSIGYAKSISERASISIGGAFSSDDKAAGVGFGFDL